MTGSKRYAFGPFLGMTEAEANEFRATIQAELRYQPEKAVYNAAFHTLSKGKTLLELVKMWVFANTKDHGVVPLGPYLYQEQIELIEYIDECWRENKPCLLLVLKARQLGMSTVLINILYLLAVLHPHKNSLVVAHKETATAGLLAKAAFCHDQMMYPPAGTFTRRHVGTFDNGSRFMIESAEGKEAGRSHSFNFVHLSEAAFYPKDYDLIAALTATLPTKGFYLLVQESTANGAGGQFYDVWQLAEKGDSGYRGFFFPWWKHSKYQMFVHEQRAKEILESLDNDEAEGVEQFGWSPERIAWRRHMINTQMSGDVDKFRQEYPATALEAFLTAGRPCFDKRAMLYLSKAIQNSNPVWQGDIRLGKAG